jgi:predicted metal-dependent hydrolase
MTDYELIRSTRRKTVAIEVHRDQRVLVRVPRQMKSWEIDLLIRKKANWITRQQQLQAKLPQKPVAADYSEHSLHYLLGEALQLRYAQVQQIRQENHSLLIPQRFLSRDENDSQYYYPNTEKHLKEWYRAQALKYLHQRMQYWLKNISDWPVKTPRLRLRYMRRYWGSCNSRSWITLNVQLVKIPPYLIDYVITHELCHLQEMNHSAAFYNLQGSLLADWSERRRDIRTWELQVLP